MSELDALPVQASLAACLLAGAIRVWLGRVAWLDRDEPGTTEVALYLLCGGGISLLYAVRVTAASELAMVVALNLSTPIVATVPGVWMAFALCAYGLCVAGILVVVDLNRRTGNRYRLQTFVILLGTLFPSLSGIVTLVDVGSCVHLAWYPTGLVVHGVFLLGPASGSGRSTPPSSRATRRSR
mgnify:CR=1 FL=1